MPTVLGLAPGYCYVSVQLVSVWGQSMESLRHCGTLLASQHWVGWKDDTRVGTNIRWDLGGGGGVVIDY